MKKVLFVATVASHIKSFHIPYLKMLKENNYEVYVVANWNLDKNDKLEYCDKFIQVPIQRSPYSIKNLKATLELKKIIQNEKFDIIHCHTPMGGVLTRLAARKARKNGTRVIYTAHGFHFYKGAPLINWLVYYPVEWFLAKYTDTLITINEEDYERAKKRFGKRCKDIQHVHGVGLDTSKFDVEISEDELEELRKEIGVNKENIVLTYVAEINKNKNQIMLIKTLQELIKENDKYRLVLVGDGKLKGKLERYVEKNKLGGYVKFLGKRNDVPRILNITNVYVASSLREGLPLNILEALYMKLPVAAMDNRGHRELVSKEYIVKNSGEMGKMIINITSGGVYKFNRIEEYLLNKIEYRLKSIYNLVGDRKL